MLADATVEQAARDRAAERALQQAAEEDSTLLGSLVAIAESGATVTVRTSSAGGGRDHRGVVIGVGRDFFVLQPEPPRPTAFIPFAGATSVRAAAGEAPAGGAGRKPPVDASFAAILGGLAAARPRVQLALRGGDLVVGDLRVVGRDVATLALDGFQRAALVVPLASIADVALLDAV